MRICIDIDGVLCQFKKDGQSYADVVPVLGAVEAVRKLRQEGHVIILYTGRHMKTCEGNVGRVLARQGLVTLQWLERHGIEFDEIYFGKPHADIYIDDNALRFESWDSLKTNDGGFRLPTSRETQAGTTA